MVRLKVFCIEHVLITLTYFNSCMVRLKDIVYEKTAPTDLYFNSCMVRLKETATALNTCKLKFQFLYGTIKGVKIFKLCFVSSVFQFLYGTIKGGSWDEVIPFDKMISIPVWYD